MSKSERPGGNADVPSTHLHPGSYTEEHSGHRHYTEILCAIVAAAEIAAMFPIPAQAAEAAWLGDEATRSGTSALN
jgi:hypothetical protein